MNYVQFNPVIGLIFNYNQQSFLLRLLFRLYHWRFRTGFYIFSYAAEAYKTALGLLPGHPETTHSLALAYCKLNEPVNFIVYAHAEIF